MITMKEARAACPGGKAVRKKGGPIRAVTLGWRDPNFRSGDPRPWRTRVFSAPVVENRDTGKLVEPRRLAEPFKVWARREYAGRTDLSPKLMRIVHGKRGRRAA